MNTRKTGAVYEEKASRWLSEQGMEVLRKNFRCKQGEIDIIGRHQGYLVFVEVKYRGTDKRGFPEEAVGIAKQKRICGAADYFRVYNTGGSELPVRYDVLAISGEEIRWHQDAFMHYGNNW